MSNITDRKNRTKLILIVIIFILTGILIGTVIYYNRQTTAKNHEKNDLFLKQSKEKIKELEEAVKKEHVGKTYKKNELELLIAKKIAAERNAETKHNEFLQISYILSCFEILAVINPVIENLQKEKEKLELEDEKYQEIEKQIVMESMKNTQEKILKIIDLFSDSSAYVKSFAYLILYFLDKYANFGPKIKPEDIEIENKIRKLLETNENGKIFMIYLFVEKSNNIEGNPFECTFLDTSFTRGISYIYEGIDNIYEDFKNYLTNIVQKCDEDLKEPKK